MAGFRSGGGGGGSGFGSGDSFALNYQQATGTTYNVDNDDEIIGVTNAGEVTINLPAAAASSGRRLIIKIEHDRAANSNGVIVDPNASELLDGAGTLSFGANSSYSAVTIYCNGTAWFQI